MKINKGIKSVLALIVILLVAFFIIFNLNKNWGELKQYPLTFNPLFIFLFIIIITFFYLIAPINWQLSLILIGQKLSYGKILKIWHSAQLVRYIPGNVAFVLGRTEFGKKENIAREKTLIATALELILVVMACLLIFLIYVISSAQSTAYLLFILIPLGLIGLHPKIFIPLINKVLKLIKKPVIKEKIKYKHILALFLFVLFTQIAEGIAYAFLLKAIFSYPLTLINILKFSAIYEGAWVIGFLSFLTPSGLGVREAALTLLLKEWIPVTTALIFPLFARVACIIVEVIIALTVIILNRKKTKEK